MEICKPTKVTLKQLVEDLNLLPGTVSAFALQLINRDIVEEFQPLPAYQKRRTEILSAWWFRTLRAPYASNFFACRRHENFYCDLRADHYSPLPPNLAEFQKVYDRCQGFP